MKLKEKYVRWTGIPLLGILLSFVFCDGFPTIPQFLKTITFTFVFWQGVYAIIYFYRQKFPKIRQTSRRIGFTILLAAIYVIVADTLMRTFFDNVFPELMNPIHSMVFHLLKTFGISAIVGMIYETAYFFHRWSQSNVEAEKLKTQHITSQLETLKNQISPHFLFNSLNTLVALIPENPNQAIEFTQKLSEVYRYILQYKDRELVRLSTELEFIQSYVYLLKMRYPENLTVEYRIKEKELDSYVAPLTLQMLIENAIKHNVISKTHPLQIEIYSETGVSVVVKNKLQKKTIPYSSTKLGLENIRKRYEYLSNRTIDIITTKNDFLVAIPLIELSEEN